MECKDCVYVKELERRVTDMEVEVKEIKSTLSEIKIDRATDKEKISTIFSLLEKMDKSIEIIASEVKKWSERPQNEMSAFKVALFSTVGSGIIMSVITFLATRK